MKQKMMDFDVFKSILTTVTSDTKIISLQGEGEPMMHPRFWDMVEEVKKIKKDVFTITNGSALVDPYRVSQAFQNIGISVDTMDPVLAEKIGRHDLEKVLKNIHGYLRYVEADRIQIQTVDFGQDLTEVKAFVKKWKMGHFIQPLQNKPDYSYRYGEKNNYGECTFNCKKLTTKGSGFYNIDGKAMPCVYIKDLSKFESKEKLIQQLANKEVPAACEGCEQIFPNVNKGENKQNLIGRFQQ
jgi:organic radical activating enzyme